jgi:hypothetical protein
LYRQPKVQIHRIPKIACLEHVKTLDLSKDAIELDEAYKVAAVFPLFVHPATLKRLQEDKDDPLEFLPDPAKLGENLLRKNLHIIIEKPNISECIAGSISSTN